MQIWSEVIQPNCHRRCQSLWPRSTHADLTYWAEALSSWREAADRHQRPRLCYCSASYLRHTCHLSGHFIDPPVLSLAPWQPAHLSAHILTVSLLKLLSLLWMPVGLLNSSAPKLIFPSIHATAWLIGPPKLAELKSKTDFHLLAL